MNSSRISRRRFLEGSAAAIGAAYALPCSAQARGKPNILFILADDLGYADLSCYGRREYRTPVLDQLAADGVMLTQGYANSAICSPTRVALATGRYQQRFKAGLDEPTGRFRPGYELPPGTPTLASVLKEAGYRTSLIGKWHVSEIPQFGPRKYGYDRFVGIYGGSADYFTYARGGRNPGDGFYSDEQKVQRVGYLTDVLTEEAVRQVTDPAASPFLMCLHYTAPHWPWEAPDDEERSKTITQLQDYQGGSLDTYAKMVRAMDAGIGRVLEALRATGKDRDTLVVFTSDNGGERFSDMWPFTGVKGELLEGGLRVPLIARWPGRIKAGSQSAQVAASMDFLPTLAAAAGAKVPSEIDGVNVLGQLTGEAASIPRTLFWRYKANGQAAARSGDWKYLRMADKEFLFNLATDPRERVQLQTVRPQQLAELKAKWDAWNGNLLPYSPETNSEDVKRFYPDRY